jgi:hypothetical protein
VLVEKFHDKPCPECGEIMQLEADYGLTGDAYSCYWCSRYEEVIDLTFGTLLIRVAS